MGTKTVINKDNTFLNIITCNFNGEILEMNFLEHTNQNEPEEYSHRFYGWKFYDYGNDLNEENINIILDKLIDFCDKKQYQNVLLIYDKMPYEENNENNENNNSLKILKELVRRTTDILFQPLVIYVSVSQEKNTSYYRRILHNYYENKINREVEEFDELNLYSFLYEENNFINQLINELWQCTIYYNQIPSIYLPMTQDDEKLEIKVQEYPFTLNLLIAGESGTGKSTYINILNNRKIAYESDNGFIKTNKINEYIIRFNQEDRQFHYKICDTLGFSIDNKELPELIKYIKDYNDEAIKIKDKIHCILYFLNENNYTRIYTEGVFSDFFNYLYKKQIKVIFVINFNDGSKHLCKTKLKKAFKLGFKSEQYKFFIEENDENIIELN